MKQNLGLAAAIGAIALLGNGCSSSGTSSTTPPAPTVTLSANGNELSPGGTVAASGAVSLIAHATGPAAGKIGLLKVTLTASNATTPLLTWTVATCLNGPVEAKRTLAAASKATVVTASLHYAFGSGSTCPTDDRDHVDRTIGKIDIAP